jgi:hypothetical protein
LIFEILDSLLVTGNITGKDAQFGVYLVETIIDVGDKRDTELATSPISMERFLSNSARSALVRSAAKLRLLNNA